MWEEWPRSGWERGSKVVASIHEAVCQWKTMGYGGWMENILLFANLWKANIAVLLPHDAKYSR